jgi:hypothetical protein
VCIHACIILLRIYSIIRRKVQTALRLRKRVATVVSWRMHEITANTCICRWPGFWGFWCYVLAVEKKYPQTRIFFLCLSNTTTQSLEIRWLGSKLLRHITGAQEWGGGGGWGWGWRWGGGGGGWGENGLLLQTIQFNWFFQFLIPDNAYKDQD